MRILLVAATEFEIRPLVSQMAEVSRSSNLLTHYRYLGHDIDVLVPGIGMMVTAFHLGQQFSTTSYDVAINAGIAGTFRPEIPIGEVVEVIEDCVTELGAEDGDSVVSVFELGLMDPDEHPYENGRLVNDLLILVPSLQKIPKVKGSTVNTIHGSRESVERVRKRTQADIESMEGAAFLYGCLSAKIPNLQLRSISNLVEERDKSNWDVELALKNLNAVLKGILGEL